MVAWKVEDIVSAVGGILLQGRGETVVTSVSTDSKTIDKGGLFVPIIGERVDAHRFIESAFTNGASATFTSREEEDLFFVKDAVYIKVEDTQEALQKLAAAYRDQFQIPLIGITGSVGKTTTKEMISAVLERKFRVLKTAGNRNSQIGLPLTMFDIHKEDQIAVIEMGMSEEGEMKKLVSVARPTHAVVTNIGVSHIAQLKTKENIRKEKMNLMNAFPDGQESILYINGDDDLLLDMAEHMNAVDLSKETQNVLLRTSICLYGMGDRNTVIAKNIRVLGEETHFTYQDSEDEEDIVLSVLGNHNVSNALVALSLGKHFGISLAEGKKGLRDYRPIAMRGQICEKNGLKIIDDSYNASPDSMKSGIQVLMSLDGVSRRIAVLADVKELGELSQKCHYEVGEYIAQTGIDELITVGTEAKAIAKAVTDAGTHILTHSFEDNAQAIDYLKEHIGAGNGILVKGSRGMHTEEIVKALA